MENLSETGDEYCEKIICLILCSAIAAGTAFGCSHKNQSEGSTQAVETANNIPEDVLRKLKAVSEVEPLTLSADKVTDEDVAGVLYVNGEHLATPCTIDSLGNSFETIIDSAATSEEKKVVSGKLTYYGMECGYFSVQNPDIDNYKTKQVSFLSFYPSENKINNGDIYPVSFNNINLGDSLENIKTQLSFMTDIHGDSVVFHRMSSNEKWKVSVLFLDGTVSTITIDFN